MLISNHAVNDEIRVNHELLLSLLRFDSLGGGKWLSTEIRTQEEVIVEIGVSKADGDDAMRWIFVCRTDGWFPFMSIVVIHDIFHQDNFFLDNLLRWRSIFDKPHQLSEFPFHFKLHVGGNEYIQGI